MAALLDTESKAGERCITGSFSSQYKGIVKKPKRQALFWVKRRLQRRKRSNAVSRQGCYRKFLSNKNLTWCEILSMQYSEADNASENIHGISLVMSFILCKNMLVFL